MPRVSAAHEQAVRERIVAAALRVFGEKGYHRATIADVVRESGLSVGAIYTYYSGKEALYLATCDLSGGRSLDELATRLAAGRTTAERLAIATGFYLDAIDAAAPGEPDLGAFLVGAWAQADAEPAVREQLRRRREQYVTAGVLLIREGVGRGELPAWVDADALAGAVVALLDGLLLERIEGGPGWRRETAERRVRAVLELLLAATAVADRPTVPAAPPEPLTAARCPWPAARWP